MTDNTGNFPWAALKSAVPGIVWPAVPQDTGAHLISLLHQLEASQWWSARELADQQARQLRALLQHAADQVPHFRRADYRAAATATDGFWAAFRALPVLDRSQIASLGATLHANAVPPAHGNLREGLTSGSTGTPLAYRATDLTEFFRHGLTLREHAWHRRDPSLRHAFIRAGIPAGAHRSWGVPLSFLFDCGESHTFSLMADTEAQARWLQGVDPDYLLTTPSVHGGLMDATEAGLLRLTRLREVRTVAETVTADFRARVRRVWNVPVTDVYSAAELGTLALQCPVSGAYHVQGEVHHLEVLDEQGRPCGPGETGRVVVTALHNFALPLIRYAPGDYAELGEPCPCGRGLPTLTRILGRHRNRLVHHDGRISWPCISSLPMADLAVVRRFQLRQRPDRSLVLRYVADRPLDDDARERLALDFTTGLECRLDIAFERVETLPISPAGKFEDFVSEAG